MHPLYELLFADRDLEGIVAGMDAAEVERTSRSITEHWPALAAEEPTLSDEAIRQLVDLVGAPWGLFIAAYLEAKLEKVEHARQVLRAVISPGVEARVQLWAWHNLRRLGEPVPADAAGQILGIVAEVPLGAGTDVLAAYADGSARYINAQGGGIIWDQRDDRITPLVQNVIDRGQPLGERQDKHRTGAVAGGNVRMSTLTPAGIYVWEGDPDQEPVILALLQAQMMLLQALVRTVLAQQQESA